MPRLIALLGPTASGKTEVAETVADQLGAVLLNADAFQVYRGLDIGTGKSLRRAEYGLMDLVAPNEPFGLGEWLAAFARHLPLQRDVVLVGGTGLYVRALTEGYDDLRGAPDPDLRARLNARELDDLVAELRQRAPELAETTDLRNPVRVRRALERLECEPLAPPSLTGLTVQKFVLDPDPTELEARFAPRIARMFADGWVEEVRQLQAAGYVPGDPAFRAIGYGEVWEILAGNRSKSDAEHEILVQTRKYAKRQRTWLRKERNIIAIEASSGRRSATALIGALHHTGE